MSRREMAAGWVLAVLSWVAAAMGVAALDHGGGRRCAQDRVELKEIYEVTITFRDGTALSFCNPTCASTFLKRTRRTPAEITVTDESTGEPLRAAGGFYVESEVFTHRESANRIHVFASREEAEKHAAAYHGRLVPCPFPALDAEAAP